MGPRGGERGAQSTNDSSGSLFVCRTNNAFSFLSFFLLFLFLFLFWHFSTIYLIKVFFKNAHLNLIKLTPTVPYNRTLYRMFV